ncbi:hypothetical protein M5K25_021391 [Dendrobium thyrsiflorum]|uniref:NAC domain-containing protein n=1 Tax=Dendrobium thyrsiflorum TaxID=117978 RepID=A0ABD0UCX8_DENTH
MIKIKERPLTAPSYTVDMATAKPTQLIAYQQQKLSVRKPSVAVSPASAPPAKLSSKLRSPAQAVRESRNTNTAPVRCGGTICGGAGRGRSDRGAGFVQNRSLGSRSTNGFAGGVPPEDGDAGKTWERDRVSYGPSRESFRSGRNGGLVNGNAGERFDPGRPQVRVYGRRSGIGRGFDVKRDGAGRDNWGAATDDFVARETEEGVNLNEKALASEKLEQREGLAIESSKDKRDALNEAEEKEPEDNGSGKDLSKRRENTDKEERAKKAMTIIEFLKPTKGKRCHGRGRGPFRGGFDSNLSTYQSAPSIEDPTQFRTLAVNKSLIVSSNSVADHIITNLAEHQMSGSLQCPSCSHKFEQKPDWLGLPAGVKFDPTDQQLIEHLEAKVSTHGLSSHPLIDEFILTIEGEDGICYTHPEKLPGVTKDGLSKHFFHRPSMAYTTGTKKRRKIQMTEVNIEQGETRWHKTGKTKPVIVKGEHKGCKKIMVLYSNPGKNRKPEKTNWVMHQYHLGAKVEDEKEGEFVVSKIFYQTQPRQMNCSAVVGGVGEGGTGGVEGAGEKDIFFLIKMINLFFYSDHCNSDKLLKLLRFFILERTFSIGKLRKDFFLRSAKKTEKEEKAFSKIRLINSKILLFNSSDRKRKKTGKQTRPESYRGFAGAPSHPVYMATANPFDLLGDDDNDDPSQLIASHQQKLSVKKPTLSVPASAAPSAKLPSKPLPPAQAVRESRNSNTAPVRGGTGRGGSVRGAGFVQNRYLAGRSTNGYSGGVPAEDGDAGKTLERDRGSYGPPREAFRGGRNGGVVNGNVEERFDPGRPPRRVYERRSGTGRGLDMKRDGAGRGNWGTATDDFIAQETEKGVNLNEKDIASEKLEQKEGQTIDANKDKGDASNEAEEKKQEDNEMTLEEYEKVREEKRKALLSMKVAERKVQFDEEFKDMQQLSIKKGDDDLVFIKLGSDKDLSKRRENTEKEERAKKAITINEFLKPTEGEKRYSPGGGFGRGRGRGSFRGGFVSSNNLSSASQAAPLIEDPTQFPTLDTGFCWVVNYDMTYHFLAVYRCCASGDVMHSDSPSNNLVFAESNFSF